MNRGNILQRPVLQELHSLSATSGRYAEMDNKQVATVVKLRVEFKTAIVQAAQCAQTHQIWKFHVMLQDGTHRHSRLNLLAFPSQLESGCKPKRLALDEDAIKHAPDIHHHAVMFAMEAVIEQTREHDNLNSLHSSHRCEYSTGCPNKCWPARFMPADNEHLRRTGNAKELSIKLCSCGTTLA